MQVFQESLEIFQEQGCLLWMAISNPMENCRSMGQIRRMDADQRSYKLVVKQTLDQNQVFGAFNIIKRN